MTDPFLWFADAVTYAVLDLPPAERLTDAVHFFVEDVVKIFVLLAVVVYVIALFRSFLAPEKVRGYIEGKPRWLGYILAVLLGAVTPFCSCSSVPLFIGFLEAGIPMGVVMAFLIASPMINEVAVVILLSVIGWKLTLIYVVTGLAVGILGGILTDRFHLERFVQDYVWKIRMAKVELARRRDGWADRAAYATGQVKEIVAKVWVYVLLGIGLGAGLHGYVPQDLLLSYAGPGNLLAVPLAVVIGVPLYSSATAIIPVAEALLGKGVAVGTVVAMMMSVTAISFPEMIILRKVLRLEMIGLFAGYLAVAFIVVGYLLNAMF